MSEIVDIRVIECVNGERRHLWYGLRECAWHHHVHVLKIKELIVTGKPLNPREKDEITFDVSPDSPWDLEERGGLYEFVKGDGDGS